MSILFTGIFRFFFFFLFYSIKTACIYSWYVEYVCSGALNQLQNLVVTSNETICEIFFFRWKIFLFHLLIYSHRVMFLFYMDWAVKIWYSTYGSLIGQYLFRFLLILIDFDEIRKYIAPSTARSAWLISSQKKKLF